MTDLERLRSELLVRIPFCPHEPYRKQRAFLALDELEAMYGGAAGGGKSDALLMAALQYVDRSDYSAMLMRRTMMDLALDGSIMFRAHQWLDDVPGVHWNGTDHRFTFPSGARLTFGYCNEEADRFRYKSAEFQFIGIDEVTTFTETMYTYMFSRLRRLRGSTIPIRMRSATNPGDIGHAWVKARFVEPRNPARPFVQALGRDNPFTDMEAYALSLAQLDSTTRDQLERGLWILDDGQRVYRHNAEHDVDSLPTLNPDGWHRAFIADLGASEVKPTTGFAQLAWHDNHPHTFVEEAWREAGIIPSTLAERFNLEIAEHGPELVCIIDEGALGHAYGGELRQRWGLPIIAAEKSEKRAARRLLNGSLEKGETRVIRGRCDDLVGEWASLVYAKNGLDEAPGLANHCSDAVLYGWRHSMAHRSERATVEPEFQSPAWWARRAAEAEEADRRPTNHETNYERW